MDRVRHPKAELVQVRPHYNRSSYHTFSGFVAAAGPSIEVGGDLGDVSPLDFVPAFQLLMGNPLPPPNGMNQILNRCVCRPLLSAGTTTMAG
jgi:hypothetical protein